MTEDQTAGIRALMARTIAMEAVVLAMVRTHNNPTAIRLISEKFAEGVRSNLLAFDWTDDQIAAFDLAFQVLISSLPKPAPEL